MPKSAARLLFHSGMAALVIASAPAAAAVQRTFVAANGSDAGPCSISAPCRTFAVAIAQTNAGGEVIVLDSAGYGPVTISKSVSIIAPAGIYAGISVFAGDGITINAGGTDTVALRGLTLNGQGGANGITISSALVVHVENCVIAKMAGMGINQLAGLLEVKDTIVRNNGNIGVFVTGPGQANLDRVRLEANNTGLAAELGGQVAMQDSVVTGSPNIGVAVTNTALNESRATITRSLITSSNYGIYVDGHSSSNSTAAVAAVSDSVISGNSVGVQVTGDYWKHAQVFLTRNTVTANYDGLKVLASAFATIDGNSMRGNVQYDIYDDATAQIGTRNNSPALTVGGNYAGTVFTLTQY